MDSSGERKWTLLLRTLYENEIFRLKLSSDPDRSIHESERIHDLIPLTDEELDKAVSDMLDVGLLEYDENAEQYVLTERGFDYAHERESDRRQAHRENARADRQRQLTRAGVYISFGILIVGLFRFIAFSYDRIGVSDQGIAVSVLVGAALVIYIILVISREELLSRESEDQLVEEWGPTPGFGTAESDTGSGEKSEHTTNEDDDGEQTKQEGEELEKE